MKRIFFVAGERSGDAHGADLIRALTSAAPGVDCEGLGGELMAAAGMRLRHDLAAQGIMGFTEVLRHFTAMRRLFLDTCAHLRQHPPDCLVLIDYPGFNIRLAKALYGSGIPIVYYISPQVWAWKRRRIYTLARYVRKLLVIFPFESEVYRATGLDVEFVGHPLIDRIPEDAKNDDKHGQTRTSEDKKTGIAGGPPYVIGLMPGSREQEIARLLTPMIEVARGILVAFPDARFVAPAANPARAAQITALAGAFPIDIQTGGMYDLLAQARFCIVASGTATLETALWGVPFVILYKVSSMTYLFARALVHTKHIGIVNILAGRRVVPEFVQYEVRPDRILSIALKLIGDTSERETMLRELKNIRALLGAPGAAQRAADAVLEICNEEVHG